MDLFNGTNPIASNYQTNLVDTDLENVIASSNGISNDLFALSSLLPNETNSTILPCPSYRAIPLIAVFTQILYGIVCLVGLCGNTLVIYVVLRFSKMQTVTNMYIVNLAIADECFLIGIPFLITTMTLQNWIFGDTMCKVYMITTSINQFTSSIFLLIMSADRYIAVCHPITSPKFRTPFISRVVSVGAWVTSAIIMTPVYIYSNTIKSKDTNRISCNIIWSDGIQNPSTFTLYSFILGFAIPLTMILIFYCLVIKKLKNVGPKNKSKEKKRSHRKVTKLVLTVITVYIICWFPYWMLQMALTFGPDDEERQCQSQTTVFFFLMAGCLSYSNSAMNPILYAFLSDNFKKSFLKACTCAAGKEINATLHMENSVFPKRQHKRKCDQNRENNADAAARLLQNTSSQNTGEQGGRASICTSNKDADEVVDSGPLMDNTSGVTMTSRSAITISTDSKERNGSSSYSKNGLLATNVMQV